MSRRGGRRGPSRPLALQRDLRGRHSSPPASPGPAGAARVGAAQGPGAGPTSMGGAPGVRPSARVTAEPGGPTSKSRTRAMLSPASGTPPTPSSTLSRPATRAQSWRGALGDAGAQGRGRVGVGARGAGGTLTSPTRTAPETCAAPPSASRRICPAPPHASAAGPRVGARGGGGGSRLERRLVLQGHAHAHAPVPRPAGPHALRELGPDRLPRRDDVDRWSHLTIGAITTPPCSC